MSLKIAEIMEDLVFPKGTYCICCKRYIDNKRKYQICDECIKKINFSGANILTEENKEYFANAFAAMGYGVYERKPIFSLKYEGHTYVARDLADIMYDSLFSYVLREKDRSFLECELIIPVPIHEDKLKTRGFNQAEKIAKHLGKKLGIQVMGDGLVRIKNTEAQRSLNQTERFQNIDGAFSVNEGRKKAIQNKHILLIDDIYTTGATAISCSKVLKKCGAKEVSLFVLSFAGNKNHPNDTF